MDDPADDAGNALVVCAKDCIQGISVLGSHLGCYRHAPYVHIPRTPGKQFLWQRSNDNSQARPPSNHRPLPTGNAATNHDIVHPMRSALLLLLVCSAASAEITSQLFRHHFIAREMPGRNVGFGSPALADFDNDGDLDFAVYNRGDKGLYWFEYKSAGDWQMRRAGDVEKGQLGSVTHDVDNDGFTDIVIGGYWYRNPQNLRTQPFIRYSYDSAIQREIHDMVVADINGDSKPDIVALGDRDGCFWYSIPDNPTRDADWPRTTITMDVLIPNDAIHSGFTPGGVGDLDGDGDADIVFPDRWLENTDQGRTWTKHRLMFGRKGPWGLSSRSWIADLDGDGDNDMLLADSDGQNCGVAWHENDGKTPPSFQPHYLANRAPGTRGSFHSMRFADFDQDGDGDLMVVEQEDPYILPLGATPRWFLWENLTDAGRVRFEERVILDARLGGHDIQLGDVDGDGDLDIVSKIWSVWSDNANQGKVHLDYLENLRTHSPPAR